MIFDKDRKNNTIDEETGTKVINIFERKNLCSAIQDYLDLIIENNWISRQEYNLIIKSILPLNCIISNVEDEIVEKVRSEASDCPRGKDDIKNLEFEIWHDHLNKKKSLIPGFALENALKYFNWNEADEKQISQKLISIDRQPIKKDFNDYFSSVLSQGSAYLMLIIRMYRYQYKKNNQSK